MIVLPRSAIARLCQRGMVEVWTPRESRPATNVIHLVRTSSSGTTFTRARTMRDPSDPEGKLLIEPRRAVLQELTLAESQAAGFGSEEEFLTWWRRRYATGPLMDEPILCWVATYERVHEPESRSLAYGAGFTNRVSRSVDTDWQPDENGRIREVTVSAVEDESYLQEWAEKAEADRLRKIDARKAAWKSQWRARRDAA